MNTRPITRNRPTRAALEERRLALYRLAKQFAPTTVRQIYLSAVAQGVVPDTPAGYDAAQQDLVHMRRSGRIPLSWIVGWSGDQKKIA
jgi:hypothetical protein